MKIKDTMDIIHKKRKIAWKKKIHDSTVYKYLLWWKSIDYLLNMKGGRWWFNSHTRLWQYNLTDRDFKRAKHMYDNGSRFTELSKYFCVCEWYFYNHKEKLWLE